MRLECKKNRTWEWQSPWDELKIVDHQHPQGLPTEAGKLVSDMSQLLARARDSRRQD